MMCMISLVIIYLIAGSLYPLTTFIQFPFPHPILLATTNLISFPMSLFVWGFLKFNGLTYNTVSSWCIT